MTKESESRPGDDWPWSTENSCSTVSEKGKTASWRSLVELGGHVGAIRSQRATDSPCTTNLGRVGEDSVNFVFNRAHWWNYEYFAVVHGAIYRDGDPASDPRPRNTLLAHGKHVRKEHSEVEVRREWHGDEKTKPRRPPVKYLRPDLGQVRGTVTRHKVITSRLFLSPIHLIPSKSTVSLIFSFFRYFLCHWSSSFHWTDLLSPSLFLNSC